MDEIKDTRESARKKAAEKEAAKRTKRGADDWDETVATVETEQMLAQGAFGYDSGELRRTLERNNDKLIQTIKDKREVHIHPARQEIRERKGGKWTTYKNSYFR